VTEIEFRKLNKKQLAALIEQVFLIPHKQVRITRRHGKRWHVHAERTYIIADSSPVAPTTKTVKIDLEGATLTAAALTNQHLRAALVREANQHQAAKERHEKMIAERKAA
jgi:hypothetical protein